MLRRPGRMRAFRLAPHFKTTDLVADHQEAENFNYKYRVEDNSSSAGILTP
jgi:hypothetical protein